jgi:hypothetical protein
VSGIRGDRATRNKVASKVATELSEARHLSVAFVIQPPAAPPISSIGGEVMGMTVNPRGRVAARRARRWWRSP